MGERRRAFRSANGGLFFKVPRCTNAQALIELALILPFLVLLVIGAFDFGRVFYTKIILTNSAREGAYYLSTHSSASAGVCDAACAAGTINAAQQEAQSSGLQLTPQEVTPAILGDPDLTGVYMGKVTAQVRMDDLILFGFFEGNTCPYAYPDDPLNPEPGDGMFTLCADVEMMVQ